LFQNIVVGFLEISMMKNMLSFQNRLVHNRPRS